MVKNTIYLLLLCLLSMIIFNISSLNIPSDKNLYRQSQTYFSETALQYDLPPFQPDDFGMGMTGYAEITLLKDVEPAFEQLIAEIEKADKNINIEFFILKSDETGNYFKNVLIAKAQQGIEVRLLYDAWGSAFTSKTYFNDLRKNGVKVAAYNPIWSSFWQGSLANRLHRKMVIIDGKKAFIGGDNIGDEDLGKSEKIGFWKDTGIMFSGDAALSLQQIFLSDWLKASGEKLVDNNFYPADPRPANNLVKIIPGGPDSPMTDMSLPYIKLITAAKENICMASPYFVPNASFLEALYQAAERNVNVQLIIPRRSDSKIAKIIQPLYINKLLSHGIKVSTYDRGFLHSKIIIIDNQAASVGSANLDRLSLSKNYEVTAIIYNKEIIQELQNDFQNDLKYSTALFLANR